MRSRNSGSRRMGLSILVIALTLVAAACGGSSDEAADSETTVVVAADANKAVKSLEDVRNAVIRIEAQGTFEYPGEGTSYNEGSSGSGFFISPEGIAVTNNHVVTGAAFLQIYVEGEDEPRNARILGVSECSDLAVIDVEGEGFEFIHLEGCVVEDDCLIGNGSMVLHRAIIRTGAIVAANSVVLDDTEVPSGALAVGSPATIKPDRAKLAMIRDGAEAYLQRQATYRSDLRRIG